MFPKGRKVHIGLPNCEDQFKGGGPKRQGIMGQAPLYPSGSHTPAMLIREETN
jgi:hypothetical protein